VRLGFLLDVSFVTPMFVRFVSQDTHSHLASIDL
jgi:hypothetical protein